VADHLLSGYVREIELARELNKHPRTLKRWRDLRIGPPFTMLGPQPIYPVNGVRTWLAAGGTAAAIKSTKR
jgi:hypothetical protein